MFWKKKKVSLPQESKIILGMVMLKDENSFDIETFSKDFKNHYATSIQEPMGDNFFLRNVSAGTLRFASISFITFYCHSVH